MCLSDELTPQGCRKTGARGHRQDAFALQGGVIHMGSAIFIQVVVNVCVFLVFLSLATPTTLSVLSGSWRRLVVDSSGFGCMDQRAQHEE